MRRLPETVASRYRLLVAKINPTYTEAEIEEIAHKLWHFQDFMAVASNLKEGVDVKEECSVLLSLALANGDVEGYCKSLLAPRTLSPEIRRKRILDKLTKQANELGLTLTKMEE